MFSHEPSINSRVEAVFSFSSEGRRVSAPDELFPHVVCWWPKINGDRAQ